MPRGNAWTNRRSRIPRPQVCQVPPPPPPAVQIPGLAQAHFNWSFFLGFNFYTANVTTSPIGNPSPNVYEFRFLDDLGNNCDATISVEASPGFSDCVVIIHSMFDGDIQLAGSDTGWPGGDPWQSPNDDLAHATLGNVGEWNYLLAGPAPS